LTEAEPDPLAVVARLADGFPGRLACSDAERRASLALAAELRARGLSPTTETCWVRPQWALTGMLHALLALIGSVLTVNAPVAGVSVLGVALGSLLAEPSRLVTPLMLLMPRRATQNVVAGHGEGVVRLVLVAAVDAGRTGMVYRRPWATGEARLRRALRGRLPAPSFWLVLATTALLGLAVARVTGTHSHSTVGAQLAPTLIALVALGIYADIALSDPSPGANADASAVAALLATLDTLLASPPAQLGVEVILAGAGAPGALGLREAIRRRRKRWRRRDVAVLAYEPCGVGTPRWWTHDGPLFALALHPQLTQLAASVGPSRGAAPHRGHGDGAAWAARRARWPALAVGCLDARDRPGPARQAGDVPASVSARSIRGAVLLALGVARGLDRQLASAQDDHHRRPRSK
jgi:hypothetical protein